MKKIIIVASTVASFFFSSAQANVSEKPVGWYFKGSYENLFFNDSFKKLSFRSHLIENPSLGASVGYKWGNLRAEGQYNFSRFENSCFKGRCDYNYSNSLALNGYYDFDNKTIFSPYVGLGAAVGQAFIVNGKHYTHIENSWVTASLGVRAYMTDNLALDVGYKSNIAAVLNGGAASIGLAYHF